MSGGIESVYNLIPVEHIKKKKPPRHQSKFRETVRVEEKQGRYGNKTLGPAQLRPEVPDKFLKKYSNPRLPTPKKFNYPDANNRKPDIPKEPPLMGIQSKKNFITTNAVENIMSNAKKPVPKYVDTAKGKTNLLEPSGLVPKYLKKQDFGEVPMYIKKRNAEVKEAQREYDEYVRERMKQGAMKQLTDAERDEMIDGMKQNWEDIHHTYQNLSVVTDTISKRHRKERLEAQMKQLERDIDLIERHKIIYISHY